MLPSVRTEQQLISICTVQQITRETRKSEHQCGKAKFLLPVKKQNQIEQVRDLDDFNKDAVRRMEKSIDFEGKFSFYVQDIKGHN